MTPISMKPVDDVHDHARHFRDAEPFRHVVLPDFLPLSLCRQLLADFPVFEDRHALNEMGQVGGKAVRMDVRDISDAYRDLDLLIQSREFLDNVSAMTGIPDLLYDPDYIGGGTHENRDGQSLDAHVDFNYHPRTRWHRRLNLIVYLNLQWEPEWGGSLELHSDPWDAAGNTSVAIPPLFNTCVIFETTESSWHGFSQIVLPDDRTSLSRKSFAIYLYTKERPAEETAPPHATIYVPQAMPDWSAGRTLSHDDVRELQCRFTRLRSQLRYLYDREKHLGAQMDVRDNALAQMRAAQRLNLLGYASQPDGVQGVWPDDWAGQTVSATFVLARATRALTLVLWSPPQLGGEQTIRIELADQSFTQALRPGMRTPVRLAVPAKSGARIALNMYAAKVWIPGPEAGGDERPLAYRILQVEFEH